MKYLVLIVDMDDDLGRKAGIKTPILGREDNIKALIKLGIADPGDSDVNAILGGIKIYDELKAENKDVEIATISGYKDVESEKCALKVKEQLDFLIYMYNPNFIYLISDGKEDEVIVKYLEGKDIFIWKKRIVVKQSETLESTYYLIQEFIKKTMEEYIPLILTFVGFSLLLYAIFADIGWRLVIGLIGLYILSEGLGVKNIIFKKIKEGKELSFGRVFPISIIIVIFILTIGGVYTVSNLHATAINGYVGEFLLNYSNILLFSLIVLLVGKFIDTIIHTNEDILEILKKYFFYLICIFIVRELLLSGGEFLMRKLDFTGFAIRIIIYILVIMILSIILFVKVEE
ncbi:hypothetical protein J422_02005 [Methanocaldococcus villosus KIN24-T80]|uniref:DUF373 family protein n=1 Tax=Methanocaldococcus villosus KIN24-T80 TaxID=1069083 RepID=N6UW49_9EURY|nr:DUF373 family protein [Methanocaldococcus villosus]ENN96544.1 hypothetical protein J422_02005 [Methanocaldococcus villosus KIN24-T80]